MINIEAIYMVMITILIMAIMAVINFRNFTKFKTKFWNMILGLETFGAAGVFIYIIALMYKYINQSEEFVEKYGEFHKYIMYIGYYFAISQIIMYVLVVLKKLSIRKFKI